jgi:hypothetical protein
LPYSEKVSALRYSISELALNPGQAALLSREADNFMRLCLRYAASNLNSGLDNCIAGLQKSAGKDRHFALATASALKQTLGLLKQCSGAEYDALAGRIVRKVLETDYVHVLTSALRQRLAERIAQGARSVDYKQLVKGF